MIVFLESQGINAYNCYAMCPAGEQYTGILDTCTRLWQTESEQATSVVSIKDVVRSSVKVPAFDKHLKKAGGHIGRNVVEITIKMKTTVRKTLLIKINKLRFRNLDNYFYYVYDLLHTDKSSRSVASPLFSV